MAIEIPKNLKELKKSELIEIAKKVKLPNYSRMSKKKLITALRKLAKSTKKIIEKPSEIPIETKEEIKKELKEEVRKEVKEEIKEELEKQLEEKAEELLEDVKEALEAVEDIKEAEKIKEEAEKLLEETKEAVKKTEELIEEEITKPEGDNIMSGFELTDMRTLIGPNYFIDEQAILSYLFIEAGTPDMDFFLKEVEKYFPKINKNPPSDLPELFAKTISLVNQMDLNLYCDKYAIHPYKEEFRIAIQYLDAKITKKCCYFVLDWFNDIADGKEFPVEEEFEILQQKFDRTAFGGPTLYSILETAYKQEIPMFYLYQENVFQLGYGKKQRRCRSTTVHTDSIKDTEFTCYKDLCKDFLLNIGFPTPTGKLVFDIEEAIEIAEEIGYPVVIKPLAGHKGQGVTTGIQNADELGHHFEMLDEALGEGHDGIITEKQVTGTDHRLLVVGGRFIAALERVPAYVKGDGENDIERLIAAENSKEVRLDNARSPLCKIKIDDDLLEILKEKGLSLSYVPKADEEIILRHVANISAGGVSINVTDKIHPKNIKLAEDIAKYLCINVFGIDALAEDISKPWDENPFSIIEINAGPGIFMHLAPAIGGSIDVPSKIIESYFETPLDSRIPIIACNTISPELSERIVDMLLLIDPALEIASVTSENGVYFNNEFFCNRPIYSTNIRNVLRNPKLDFAIIEYTTDDIWEEGMLSKGSDLVILDNPDKIEETLMRDLLPDGVIILDADMPISRDIIYENQGRRIALFSIDKDNELINEYYGIIAYYNKEENAVVLKNGGKIMEYITLEEDEDILEPKDEVIYTLVEYLFLGNE